MQACINGGPEMRRSFEVRVRHAGKPLVGVSVKITLYGADLGKLVFAGATGVDGKLRVHRLPPGDYQFDTDYLGVSAGSYCFHVTAGGSDAASGQADFIWGDYAVALRAIAGDIVESRIGVGQSALLNLIRRTSAPLPGVRLTLRSARTASGYAATSDENGVFDFGEVSTGTYVLHVEGAGDGESDHLVAITNTGKAQRIRLTVTRAPAGPGMCGPGTDLRIQP
jgi:hypothetical protein